MSRRFIVQERGPAKFVIVDADRLDGFGYYVVLPALCVSRRMAEQLAEQYDREPATRWPREARATPEEAA